MNAYTNFSAFCIKRPAFTIVISLVMVVVGLIGLSNLPIRWIPNVDVPVVSIVTSYPGASASLVEQEVTKKIEDGLSGVNGVDSLVSHTSRETSNIIVSFKLGYNLDTAVADIRNSVERIQGSLPKDIHTPLVGRSDPSDVPLMFIAFFDAKYDKSVLSSYIKNFFAPSLETIDGVSGVDIIAERAPAVRVWLNPVEMASMNVTTDDVIQALTAQSVAVPTGQIHSRDRLYDVVADMILQTPAQFDDLIVRHNHDHIVRLKDIAKTVLGVAEDNSSFRLNGRDGIALSVQTQSTANPLDVAEAVQKKVSELTKTLPEGMQVKILFNSADEIRASLHSVYETFFESIFFVWLVIFAFLCSFRATLIPIITVPVCLISTFALLYFFNFSINTITMMALVLAIGLVVDDAIVMLENINRHIESGLSVLAASLQGSYEVIFAIIAMTITLAAVYIPIAFTPGLLGILFKEFTITLAGAVIISGVVALSLSPMMCAHLLKSSKKLSRYENWVLHEFSYLQKRYRALLIQLFAKRHVVAVTLFIFSILGLSIYLFLPAELAPAEDTNQLRAYVMAPHSASYAYTDSYVRQLEALYANTPDIDFYISQVNSSHGFQFIQLKPAASRQYSTTELVKQLTKKAAQMPGVRVNIVTPSSGLSQFTDSEGSGDNVGISITTTGDYIQLQQVTENLVKIISNIPGILHVTHRLKWDSQQLEVFVNRDHAANLGVNISSITQTLSTLLAGQTVGKNDYGDVMVQMRLNDLSDPNSFQKMYVRNLEGNMVPLSQVLSIQPKTAPTSFNHFERLRSDTISVSLAPDFKLAKAIHVLQAVLKENLPDQMKYTFVGEAKDFLESSGKTFFTFGLALVFIYLVLVAQFESFTDPLIILLTVPFAAIGAILTLKLLGGSLNIYSNIGLITLIGLIAKHGILITEFANRLRERGESIQSAVLQAALLRLRPILMTTGAMVLGAMPLAFAMGAGAETRQPIGLVITGGLIVGTVFSLLIVPIAYTYFAPWHRITVLTHEEKI